jgi:tetratricopeptide (TPR) repeat protein
MPADGYREALALDSVSVVAIWGLGRTLNQQKKYAEALAELGNVDAAGAALPIIIGEIGFSYAASGRTSDARRILQKLNELSKQTFVDPYVVAAIYVALDDRPRTFEWLEKAYDVKSSLMVALASDPKWDTVRNEPQFKGIVKRVGF